MMNKEIITICERLGVEAYVTPEIEAVEFETEDVITTSGMIETPIIPISSRDVW